MSVHWVEGDTSLSYPNLEIRNLILTFFWLTLFQNSISDFQYKHFIISVCLIIWHIVNSMIKTFLLCVLVLMMTLHQAESRIVAKFKSNRCKIKIVFRDDGTIKKIKIKGDCFSFSAGLRRRETIFRSEERSPLFRALADEASIAVKEMKEEGLEEKEVDFEVFNGKEDQPNLLVRTGEEEEKEFVVVPLDEVSLDIDRSKVVQSEEDADFLEDIEDKLSDALAEAKIKL